MSDMESVIDQVMGPQWAGNGSLGGIFLFLMPKKAGAIFGHYLLEAYVKLV